MPNLEEICSMCEFRNECLWSGGDYALDCLQNFRAAIAEPDDDYLMDAGAYRDEVEGAWAASRGVL